MRDIVTVITVMSLVISISEVEMRYYAFKMIFIIIFMTLKKS